ncbi:MAG TPA: haloalkane dehalogenase [Reyranella sp.]|nr:haloalkane dehalogenase [Reyranella sp.]
MQAVRTPDDGFADLPGWPYVPFYHQRTDGLRVHYVDTGPRRAARTWLCLHGQPTWSYLYRRMIPEFRVGGDRVVAPDFLGFGRSDKPVEDIAYSFDFHRRTVINLIEALDLRNIALVVQDWGGLIGLTLPMTMPDRFTALLVMNTTLGTGDKPLSQGFLEWRAFSNRSRDMDVTRLMQRACPHLNHGEAMAYAAPFPDASYKAGVRAFPNLVPDTPDAPGASLSRQARDFWRNDWTGKSLMAIGMQDPVLGPPVMRALHADIRNCPPPLEIAEGGHFLQEWGETIARAAVEAL